MKPRYAVLYASCLAVAQLGCNSAETTTEPDVATGGNDWGSTPLTWYGRAQPLIEARCAGCHSDNGIAPFALETLDQVRAFSPLIRLSVEQRLMPPMPPDDRNCRKLSDARLLLDEERAALVQWIDDGLPEGEPSDIPRTPPPRLVTEPSLGEPTSRVAFSAPYVRSGTMTDAYRCIVVDPGWTRATTLRAISIDPDNTAIVHHAILYAQLPDAAAAVDALDAADPGLGYECFGDAGFTGAKAIGSWVPGSGARAFPGGATLTAPVGTRFVLQMHYNFLSGDGEDRSALTMWQANAASGIKAHGLVVINPDFLVPAGETDFSATGSSPIIPPGTMVQSSTGGVKDRVQSEPGRGWGVSAHMHLHGKSARLDLVRKDGSEECLLDIPRWDFNWQGDYRFVEPVDLLEGDAVRLTCTWDNSTDRQPVVNGEQVVPRDLTWGSGSLDEMCLGTVKMTPP